MPTCVFPAHRVPETVKLCAVSRRGPGVAVKVVPPRALYLDSRASCLSWATYPTVSGLLRDVPASLRDSLMLWPGSGLT
jgi:hypothetical protein